MSGNPVQADFGQLVTLIVGLFVTGALGGALIPPFGERLRRAPEAMRSLAMTVALTTACLGGLVTCAGAGLWLWRCDSAATSDACHIRLLIWQGPDLALADLPAFGLVLYMDALAALFVLLVGFFTVCVAVYSMGWLAHDNQRASVAAGFNLFALSMLMVLVVDNAFWLLLALELLSLTSGYLVLYKGRKRKTSVEEQEESRHAIRTYLIVSHLSVTCMTVSVIMLALQYHSLDMTVFRSSSGQWGSAALQHLCFAFCLVGLGIRAGMVPFHFWVPIAHPQLPTNLHAMMSSVMLKIAVFLMIRFFFEFLKPIQGEWGIALLVLASLTAVVSVFYALLSTDLKRALAYHSTENIGIILAGLGLALLFASRPSPEGPGSYSAIVGLALIAALFHTCNHAIFKTLLFLGTGAIEKLTGTVEIDELGGMLRRFPWTGIAFLTGAIAIAGFPPFNGFISEWLILQSLFVGADVFGGSQGPLALLILLLTVFMLALAFAMTALAFVKIAGTTLLGFPRSSKVPRTPMPDVPWSMRSVMALLGLLCLLIGVFPWLLIPVLQAATTGIGCSAGILSGSLQGLVIGLRSDTQAVTAFLPALPLLTLALLPCLSALLLAFWRVWRRLRSGPVWAGGEPYAAETMQYTGAALSSLLWTGLSEPYSRLARGPLPASFAPSASRQVHEIFNRFYNYGISALLSVSERFGNRVQNGDIRTYLLYIFAVFITVLILLAAR